MATPSASPTVRDATSAFTQRLYRRLGWRLIPAYIAVAVVMTLGMIALVIVAVVFGYLNGTAAQYRTALALVTGAFTAAVTAGLLITRRAVIPAIRWLRDSGAGVTAEEAWVAAVRYPPRLMTTIALIGVLATPGVGFPYLAAEFGLSTWELVGGFGCAFVAVAFIWVVVLFLAELVLKPLVADIATALPPDWRGPTSRWNTLAKSMTALPAVAVSTAIFAGAFIPDNVSPGARLAISGAAGLVVGLFLAAPLIFMVTETILEPLRSLRAATARVGQGDYSTPIPPTTADEFGEVVVRFNAMQQGLRERERLASEKVELLEEIRASRARIVSASDAERRRVERNLHDGAQQRLVAMALRLRMMEDHVGRDPKLSKMVAEAGHELSEATDDLRELARGLHPQVLSVGGLAPALEQLAERAPIPVAVKAPSDRYPDPVESTAYFVASEALANVAKYSRAKRAEVSAERRNGRLVLAISDDGVGGANPESGSGLTGLADRVAALDGQLTVESPSGAGTTVTVELPLSSGS